MAFLAIRDALLSRLLGAPYRAATRGLQARKAASQSTMREAVESAGSLSWGVAPSEFARDVTVVPYDIAGRDYTNLPCVSVWLAKMPSPRRTDFIFKDDIRESVPGAQATVTEPDGTTVTGSALVKERAHPRPFDYTFSIRVWGRGETDCIPVVERVFELLEERGYIEVTLRDGSTITYDTIMSDIPEMIPVPAGVLTEGDEGEYSVLMTYTVEGYTDTTDAKTLVRMVQSRTLEIEDLVTASVESHEPDSSTD